MKKRQKYDMNSPQAKAVIDEIVHGTFMTEGMMVAFPLCFPGATSMIPADESFITALDVTSDGTVYGGTSGKKVHLFVGMFHGATGVIYDMGTVDNGNECTAICCGKDKFVAFVNGPEGGRAVSRKLQGKPFDLLQEWGFARPPLDDLGFVVEGETIVDAVLARCCETVVGTTENHLFTVDLDSSKIEIIAAIPGVGRLSVTDSGGVIGRDDERNLWRFDPESKSLTRKAIPLPEGQWQKSPCSWAEDPVTHRLYTADDSGNMFFFTEKDGFSGPLGQTRLSPVGPMAVSFDGRLFGNCGDGISRFFVFDPDDGELKDIGVAVSVIQRRRYGYEFACAGVGRDGQIYFGEKDDLGHLWIYFPKIKGLRL